VNAIKLLITQSGQPPDVDSVRTVDRRLKLCKNPEKVVGSSAYLAKKKEEERKAEEKRNRKAEEVRKAIEDGDPFGDVLREKAETGLVDDDDDDD
jgi:cyclin H